MSWKEVKGGRELAFTRSLAREREREQENEGKGLE